VKMAQAFSPEMKDADLDWESITGMIQEGEQGKIVEVEDEVHHKTVEVWVECRASAAGTNPTVSNPIRSAVQGGADQLAKLLVGDAGGVLRPQPDRPLAGLELGMAGDEAAVVALLEAVDRHPVLPHAKEQAVAADLVGRDLVGEHQGSVGVRLQDQPVEAVEQRPVPRVDGLDVVAHSVVHRPSMRGVERRQRRRRQRRTPTSLSRHGRRRAVAVDGKTLPGARHAPDGRQVHLLAAMDHTTRAVLAQRQVDGAPGEALASGRCWRAWTLLSGW
jgi:hypothetical protein